MRDFGGLQKHFHVFPLVGRGPARSQRHVLSLVAQWGGERRQLPCARHPLPLPPRGQDLMHWRVWALSSHCGGERGFGPGPNPQGGGGMAVHHCWDQRWPLVASRSSLSHSHKEVRAFGVSESYKGFGLEGPRLVAIRCGGLPQWALTTPHHPSGQGAFLGSGQRVHGGPVNVSMEIWSTCPWRSSQRVLGGLLNLSKVVWSTCPWTSICMSMKTRSRHPLGSTQHVHGVLVNASKEVFSLHPLGSVQCKC